MGLRFSTGLGPIRYSVPLSGGRKRKKGAAGGGIVLLLLLCFGGCAALGAVTGNDDNSPREPVVSETTYAPAFLPTLEPTSASPSAVPTTSKPSPKPSPTRKKTVAPAPRTTEPEEEDVYYANCSEVRAAGAAPLYRGDPGYSRKLDRDGDGVACES